MVVLPDPDGAQNIIALPPPATGVELSEFVIKKK
jgi:hypothetical protein